MQKGGDNSEIGSVSEVLQRGEFHTDGNRETAKGLKLKYLITTTFIVEVAMRNCDGTSR